MYVGRYALLFMHVSKCMSTHVCMYVETDMNQMYLCMDRYRGCVCTCAWMNRCRQNYMYPCMYVSG